MNITITPTAEKFMRRVVRFNGGTPQSGFRLKVTAGGCSGLASEFTVEPSPLPGDATFDCNGLSIFLSAESWLLLEGGTIDFGESIAETGLLFRNPNAPTSKCGSHGASALPAMAMVDVTSIRRKS